MSFFEQALARQAQRTERNRELDDDIVMSFRQWCAVNAFSTATGRRLVKSGQGPVLLRLSPRRIGITIAANRAWQTARAR
jgi:hypothetical protein